MYKKTSLRAKNKTIVMLHGNASSSKVFEPVFQSEIPYSLLAFDLAGHGNSEHDGKYCLQERKEQLIIEIRKIEGEVMLVGNSLGGHLVLEILPDLSNVKGILVFGTPPVKKPMNMEEAFLPFPHLSHFFNAQAETREEMSEIFEEILTDHSLVDGFVEDFFKADPMCRAQLGEDLASGEWTDELQAFREFRGEKAILHGVHDPTVNMDYLKSLQNETQFELTVHPDCGHYPSVEKPEFFVEYLTEYAVKCFED